MPSRSAVRQTPPMSDAVPFCQRCGRPGPSISGMHPRDEGIVRWTLYRCGHVHSEIVLDDASQPQPIGARAPREQRAHVPALG